MDGPVRLSAAALSERHCRFLAATLIVGSALLRLAYLACNCPLDLAPDEAHYWDWSRHLDWSYYSKGPGVAWLIRLSWELFGGLSLKLTGSEMLAVRLPAVVCGSLLLTSMYLLTIQVSGRHGVALLVVAVGLTTPTISAGSSLMTIDAPYCCCWGWALVLAHRAVFQRCTWAWWLTGVIVGLGILFKYTMVVWLPSLAFFLLASREYRTLLWSRGFWILCAIASLSAAPILLWNAQHEWVSFHHVSNQAGLREAESTIHWFGPLQFVVVQCGLWLVFWFVVWARAMLAHAPWKRTPAGFAYLWWMSAPMFGVFLLFAFKTGGGEPNWPVTAYVAGLVLGLLWMVDEFAKATGWYRRLSLAGLATACIAGILLVFSVHFSVWLHPLLEPLAGPVTARQPFPLRRLDPTLRLRGWQELAGQLDRIRGQLRGQNEEPVLAGVGWSMPGLLGFYCADHPVVYSLGLAFGDRRSQYDLWRPNPVWDVEQFAGRTFIVVAGAPLDLHDVFDAVETHHVVTHLENGRPLSDWVILVCRGYRGFKRCADPAKSQFF